MCTFNAWTLLPLEVSLALTLGIWLAQLAFRRLDLTFTPKIWAIYTPHPRMPDEVHERHYTLYMGRYLIVDFSSPKTNSATACSSQSKLS
ncbi:hypothetical protein B0T20DRAFT_250153 [Sordaria brevicollis]|uniref:Uncharacterized protein n=1 Tax=Sordaria brevicollis TaxID=83679 RepID=A0AAE0UB01_SORBR|nr:hypothetical protein B0T20DRAFT_250153 [Sordaria brevicollis]